MKSLEELTKWAHKLDADRVFELSTRENIPGSTKSLFYNVAIKIRNKDSFAYRQIEWFYKEYTKINLNEDIATCDVKSSFINPANKLNIETRHLCVRTAWHDNKWNGRICKKPEANIYCVGEYSLLSDRVRRRRKLDIETREGCADCKPEISNMGDYQPPCFWGINAFGEEDLVFRHDNPVASEFPHIEQKIPPYSIISWPFKLSFVRDKAERESYKGNYYPKDIFENRIKNFQDKLETKRTIVFLYSNFSNPVSGEDMKYLVTGCAYLEDIGETQRFDVTEEELQNTKKRLHQPNFPTLNWAIRYSIDYKNSGVRLPYHEYLEKIQSSSGITEEQLHEIAVTIEEPELREGFTYVAKHIDDDQALYLLMKIRKSLHIVQSHSFISDYDVDRALEIIETLIKEAWNKRGYIPGIYSLLNAIPGLRENYKNEIMEFVRDINISDQNIIDDLITALESGNHKFNKNESLIYEVIDFLDEYEITALDFLRLASINLTEVQFKKIITQQETNDTFISICKNPYLLHEAYVPGEGLENKITGEKVDGRIDLYKIDIALLPVAKYQKRINNFHNWRITDYRRIRAVVIELLRSLENVGDCWLDVETIINKAESYSLFYKQDAVYKVKTALEELSKEAEKHFQEKLVIKHVDNEINYYLKEIYDDERYVEDYIEKLCERQDWKVSAESLKEKLPESITKLTEKIGDRFDPEQFTEERKKLYSEVAQKSFYVITGSPGAGKSYELLQLIDYFKIQVHETCLVLSLTGKAVLRLLNNEENFLGINAKTIDKFLNENEYETAQAASSIYHNVIIDESSMVDLPKLARVLRSLKTDSLKRLILVGDPHQLPPIGFGKPFFDIVEYLTMNSDRYNNHRVSLEINCRAELSDEYIEFTKVFSNENKFAEYYLSQTKKEGVLFDGGLDVVAWSNRDELNEIINDHVSKLLLDNGHSTDDLPGFFGIDGHTEPKDLERFQVLSPYRNGYFGVSGINLHFQENLRENIRYEPGKGEVLFKLHDKVIHTENEYRKDKLFVSNGSLGGIFSNGRVFFDGHDKPIRLKDLYTRDSLELAYAITVHKAQGSGFNYVFVVLPEKARYSYRELIYTALTRVRNKVTLLIQRTVDESISDFLSSIRNRSAVLGRRTSLFNESGQSFAYSPEEGVIVKSRVEYIIYRKLLEAKLKFKNFKFQYEKEYEVLGKNYNFHPDFNIQLNDGREIYWEHLGRVNSKSYLNTWDRRRNVYEAQNDFDKILTTDELKGISDQKIDEIIASIIENKIISEDNTKRFSSMHFSLR